MRVVLLLALFFATPVVAVQPDEMLADPALEMRAREISKGLRCLVCRNESIDDSNADLARDLRLLVRERLVAGDSDEEAVAYIVDRYGEYVLLKPTFGIGNAFLWFAGPVMLIIGGSITFAFVRSRSKPVLEAPELSEEERSRLDELVGDGAD
jgi:cytochrome c-type biogenesis protein CcmH